MITIYYKQGCKLCTMAKEYFTSNNIEYESINLVEGKNRDARKFYRSLGIKDLPVITYKDNDGQEFVFQSWNDTIKRLLDETRTK